MVGEHTGGGVNHDGDPLSAQVKPGEVLAITFSHKLPRAPACLRFRGFLQQPNLFLKLIDLRLKFGNRIAVTDVRFLNRGYECLVFVELFGDASCPAIGFDDFQIRLGQRIAQAHQTGLAVDNVLFKQGDLREYLGIDGADLDLHGVIDDEENQHNGAEAA